MGLNTVMAVLAVASTAMGAFGTIHQGAYQQQQAATQEALARRDAQMAEQNARLAEEEGREARRNAHDDAQRARLEAARMIGQERAASAVAGAQVDTGSALDLNLDIAERGEVDALRRIEQGDQEDYRQRLRAGQYTVQAQNALVRADQASSAAHFGRINTGVSLLSGALQQGKGYVNFLNKKKPRA